MANFSLQADSVCGNDIVFPLHKAVFLRVKCAGRGGWCNEQIVQHASHMTEAK